MIYMINPKRQKFYWLILQQDLFGVWGVRKIQGCLNNNYRKEEWLPYSNKLQAAQELTEMEYKQRQHGYIYADIENVDYFDLKPQTLEEVMMNRSETEALL